MSASMVVASKDEGYATRYNNYVGELDSLIKSLVVRMRTKAAVASTDHANQRLVEMEETSFEHLERQRADRSARYQTYTRIIPLWKL